MTPSVSARRRGHEVSQTNFWRRSLVLLLGLLASFAVLWIDASPGGRAEAQQNTPATGTVTITGTAGVGELLTAHASGITDAEGLTNANFSFIWLVSGPSDPGEATARVFAHGERYYVLPVDAGLKVMVAVAFFDDAGNFESIQSATTAVVPAVAPAPPLNLTASSTAAGELSLRWQAPSWMIQDWIHERSSIGNGGSDITGYKVQWKRSTGSWTVPADVSEETVAVETETHTITNLTGGQTYTLRVIATNGVGDGQPREITRAINRLPTGAPTITGTPRVGDVLTVDTSSIADEDGLTNPRFGYGWRVAPGPPNDSLLRHYRRSGYLVRPIDVGRTIQTRVSFTDDANFSEALHSTPTTVVTPSSPDPPRNLTASPIGGGALNLEWEAPGFTVADWVFQSSSAVGDGGSPITSYTAQWKEAAGSWTNPADVSSATVSGTTHAITGLTPGVPYSLRVVATNPIGDSTPSPDLTVTVRKPPITFRGPIASGGGGGGPPPAPIPSDADFDWNVTRDIESLDPDNELPTGIWSDGETLWVLENSATGADLVFAYDLETGERVADQEFELDRRNRFSHGIWSDGETVWVADSGQDQLFAYLLESGERDEAREFALAERNRDPRGIWSDGEVMYVLDSVKDALFVYNFETGDLLAEHALDKLNKSPRGIWSDGVTIWVSDDGAKRLFAYEFVDTALVRNEDLEFSFRSLLKAGNGNPRGIWSDGDVMFVADESDDQIYTYNIPDAIIAQLASLSLSDLEIGEFSAGRRTYTAMAATSVTLTSVEAIATQDAATVVIAPSDADGDGENGHQVALGAETEITIAVTSGDGSRTKNYRIRVEKPPCLTGLSAERLSEVTFVGGSLDELLACARSFGLDALHHYSDGWVGFFLEAPEFLNQDFRNRFAEGLPAGEPLIANREPQPVTTSSVPGAN